MSKGGNARARGGERDAGAHAPVALHPLLERLKFLSIFSTNLDEFFMIRVSGLMEELEEEVAELSPDGLSPAEQLREISLRLRPMLAAHLRCLHEDVLPALARHGVELISYEALTPAERERADTYFREHVFPVLTPQAVDPSHPFPYISNLSLNLGLMIEPRERAAGAAPLPFVKAGPRFARVKIPPTVPRLVAVDAGGRRFALLGSVIAANAHVLFPGMKTGRSHLFRVTRDADIELMEDEAGDLLQLMVQQLRKRRFGAAVRLEVAAAMPAEMVAQLTAALELGPEDVYVTDGFMNVPDLMPLYALDLPELKDRPLPTTLPPALRGGRNVFAAVRDGDVLLHHPYTSYTAVTDFISAAAHDPDVVAIKMCLYRTGRHSPVVQALMEASARGKQVAVLVELKARFDEENNIEWARQLERGGVHVATGNYNPVTSRAYTDFGLFTADEEFGSDASELFNFLTGCSRQTEYLRLLVAPVNLRQSVTALIRREREHHLAGRPARVVAKTNSLTDTDIIRELYEASQAGVPVDLIVRGVCMLRPGVSGLSETITVRSIVGRFLEHSRAFFFKNGGDPDVYIGSADLMQRNLDR
ncbi:MAG: polyphosphate kinase, partial [Acidobacteria bacterium]|nr:polyphosphate kinase [Acidobacteriota bacterium]